VAGGLQASGWGSSDAKHPNLCWGYDVNRSFDGPAAFRQTPKCRCP